MSHVWQFQDFSFSPSVWALFIGVGVLLLLVVLRAFSGSKD